MEEFNPQLVAKRSIKGVFAFASRSVVIKLIAAIRDFWLAILLGPSVFGIYFVVDSFVSIISYFSDVGLAGALIQKKEPITQEELKTTFTTQQALILSIVSIALLFSSQISAFFHFPREGQYLLQASLIAFFLSSLKVIPSVILERNLEFGKFVIPQVFEEITYATTLLLLAYKGYGIMSFTYAILLRAIVGLVVIYIVCPWKIQIGFSKQALSHLTRFGIPFQVNSLLALVKDNLLILFLGKVLPFTEVGYIAFAQKWTFQPLRIVMDNVIRVTFASFSRLQHDKQALGSAVEKSLLAGTSLIFPALVGIVITVPYVIELIPRLNRYEPAYFAFVFFAINAALASVLVPLTNLLNAIGKIKITLYFMIAWTIITWVLTPLSISLIGFNGFPAVSALVNISVFVVIYMAKKYVPFSAVTVIKNPFLASLGMGILLLFINKYLVVNIPTLIVSIVLGASLYAALLFLLGKEQILADIRFIKENLKK